MKVRRARRSFLRPAAGAVLAAAAIVALLAWGRGGEEVQARAVQTIPADSPAAAPMTPGVVGPNQLVNVGDPGGPHPNETQSTPTIAVSGDLLCSAFHDSQHAAAVRTGYSWKLGAAAWVHPGLVPVAPPFVSFIRNPVLTVDRAGVFNLAHLASTAAAAGSVIAVSRTPDCNAAWAHTNASAFGPALSVDKPWIDADLRAGAAPAGNTYVCWTDWTVAPGGGIRASTAPLGGAFGAGLLIRAAPAGRVVTGCQIAVNQTTGAVYLAWWEAGLAAGYPLPQLWGSSCTPGLGACGPAGPATPVLAPIGAVVAPPCPSLGPPGGPTARALAFAGPGREIFAEEWPAMAINQLTQDIYLAWNEDIPPNGPEIQFEGFLGVGVGSWPVPGPPPGPFVGPLVVHPAIPTRGLEQFMPAMAWANSPLPFGTVKITYYNRTVVVGPPWLAEWDAANTARGAGLWANEAVSLGAGVPFGVPQTNPNFDPAVANCYMGHYNHITADPAQFHMVWGDNRTITHTHPDPDVYYDRELIRLPVGGLAQLPDVSGSSGANYALLAGGLAGAALALAVGGWYARRRWLR